MACSLLNCSRFTADFCLAGWVIITRTHPCSFTWPKWKKLEWWPLMTNWRTTQRLSNSLEAIAAKTYLFATLKETRSRQVSTLYSSGQPSATNHKQMNNQLPHPRTSLWMTTSRMIQIQVLIFTIKSANLSFPCTFLPTQNCRCRGLKQSLYMERMSFCRCEAISRKSLSKAKT